MYKLRLGCLLRALYRDFHLKDKAGLRNRYKTKAGQDTVSETSGLYYVLNGGGGSVADGGPPSTCV